MFYFFPILKKFDDLASYIESQSGNHIHEKRGQVCMWKICSWDFKEKYRNKLDTKKLEKLDRIIKLHNDLYHFRKKYKNQRVKILK